MMRLLHTREFLHAVKKHEISVNQSSYMQLILDMYNSNDQSLDSSILLGSIRSVSEQLMLVSS